MYLVTFHHHIFQTVLDISWFLYISVWYELMHADKIRLADFNTVCKWLVTNDDQNGNIIALQILQDSSALHKMVSTNAGQ